MKSSGVGDEDESGNNSGSQIFGKSVPTCVTVGKIFEKYMKIVLK